MQREVVDLRLDLRFDVGLSQAATVQLAQIFQIGGARDFRHRTGLCP